MGKIYEKWLLSSNCFWESIQLKWAKIFGQPLHFDSDLCGKISWADKMDKITQFIFRINPGMISFMKKRLGKEGQNSVQTAALRILQQQNKTEYDETVRQVRLALRDDCLLDAVSNSVTVLVTQKPWSWIGCIFGYGQKTVTDEPISGNLSTDRLMRKLGAQWFIITWIERQLNRLLN